ncbi:hypothetical protein [Deefgea piscis]|nr:hypothetical protein [Deefgea piscis]QZA80416.1 hypothetical protein K4H25_12900 [Deefgea piscis]
MSDETWFMLVLFAATFFPIAAWLLPWKKSAFPNQSVAPECEPSQRE